MDPIQIKDASPGDLIRCNTALTGDESFVPFFAVFIGWAKPVEQGVGLLYLADGDVYAYNLASWAMKFEIVSRFEHSEG